MAILDIKAKCGNRFSLEMPDLEDFSATELRMLLSSGLIHELHVGSHQIGSLEDSIKAIDGTSITTHFTVPELYSRNFAPVGRHRYRFTRSTRFDEAWVSPLSLLPIPQQFPITQLVFVRWPAPAPIHGDSVVPWSQVLTLENSNIVPKSSSPYVATGRLFRHSSARDRDAS